MKLKQFAALAASTAIATTMVAAPASADSIQSLQRQIIDLQDQIDNLQAPAAKSEGDCIKVKWEPAPSIKSCDGLFEMNVRGRIFVDAGFISDDDDTMDVEATEFRTARLGIEGKAWKDIKYKAEFDFADNEVDAKDVYLQWKPGWGGGTKLTFGQFKTPNSLEEQTSSRYITFVERASITDAFSLARQIGIGLGWGGEANGMGWTLNVGAYRGDMGTGNDHEGTTFAARGTLGPSFNDVDLHLGASVRYRTDGSDTDAPGNAGLSNFRYRQRPHHHLSSDRFVETPRIAEDDLFYGAELGLVAGPFSIQGEYAWQDVNLNAAGAAVGNGNDPTFSGGYVDVSFFLTGEKRAYSGKKGKFGRIKVNDPVFEGGLGAWQIAYRYDMIDLTDEGIQGGEQDTHIIGLNWYLNRHTRMMVNYAISDIENGQIAGPNGADGENEVKGVTIRAQVDW